ncbi:unnamed protein product [Phytophthora fragariaefolia]|uniref:Unnamed protein product n=1 Tax=Phytophthora fragariaefolia TaxID=1490495 RepID=A0A9W6WRK2_9STRA|nr:unnamed protein product [Phytophthora fragariaefolia]
MESPKTTEPSAPVAATPTVGIHALVNRLLERITGAAGVEEPLTSHSFRRGGAQHTNASSELTAEWIFDRGVGNLTMTNKAYACVFNTPKEDHQVAKLLSGMASKHACMLPSLDAFDSVTQEEISHKLFNASHALGNRAFNICCAVRDVLTATIILHYLSLMKMNAEGPAMKTIDRCVEASGATPSCLLAWSQQLTKSTTSATTNADDLMEGNMKAKAAFEHPTALIERLIELNQSLEARVKSLEAACINTEAEASAGKQTKRPRDDDTSVPAKRRRRSKTTPLIDTWFVCYTAVPRGWHSTDKRKKSDAKWLVAFMKLLIADGYTLDESSASYKDDVRQLGELVSGAVTAYLLARSVPSKGSNAVLKALRRLHREESLNSLITAYNQRLTTDRVVDPVPAHHQSVLKPLP